MAKSENLTVLLTDIVNFSEKTVASSRADMGELMRIHNRLLKSTVHFYGGQYVKSTGDGMLAVFRTTTNAVQCGMAIQDTIAEYNQTREPEQHIHVRVALNLGEVSWTRGDIVGEAVNITARIEEVTPPDEVYISGTVYLAMNKAEVATRFVKKASLKGVGDPVAIHMVPRNEKSVLVATGEPASEPDEGALPYGGMPRPSAISKRDRLLSLVRQPWFISTASALLTVVLLVYLAYSGGWLSPKGQEVVRQVLEPAPFFTPSTTENGPDPVRTGPRLHVDVRELLTEAEGMIQAGQFDELQAWIRQQTAQGAAPGVMALVEGHLAYRQKQLPLALDYYAQALSSDSAIRHDDLLARNLVATLGYLSKPAAALIEQYATSAMVDYLAQRSGQAGPLGRAQAVRLLTLLGHEERVDELGYGRVLIENARSCPDYKTAIEQLRKSADPAAIPVIEQALGQGLVSWYRNRCWKDTAEAAIRELRKLQ